MTRLGPICRIQFSTRRAGRKIKWQQSRRLTPGSMLAVTTARDMFKTTCKIVTVAQRPYTGSLDQFPPEVDIFWAHADEAVFDPMEELVMVESRNGFFEAIRHVLLGIQLAADAHTRLDSRIVYGNRGDKMTGPVAEVDLSTLVHHIPAGRASNCNEAVELVRA